MKAKILSQQEIELFGNRFPGDRSSIFFDGDTLHYPDELSDAIEAFDFSDAQEVALEHLKDDLKAQIDARAEVERLRYITPGAGQAMTYAQKAEEARLCLNTTAPDAEEYPLLAAEIGITATTLIGVAQVVATANAQWLQIGAAIERARLGAKAAIDAAATVEAAKEAANVVWPAIN